MLMDKHYLWALIVALLLGNQIIYAQNVQTEENAKINNNADDTDIVQLTDKTIDPISETETGSNVKQSEMTLPEDPQVGQSLMALLSQRMGTNFGTGVQDPMSSIGLLFPALHSLLSWGNTFPPMLNAPFLGSTAQFSADPLPAASKVVLVLADDKRSRNVKRSPIFPADFMRQVRQDSGAIVPQGLPILQQMLGQNLDLSQAFSQMSPDQVLQQAQQLLQQTRNGDLNQMWAQVPILSQVFGQSQVNDAVTDEISTSDDGNAPQPPVVAQQNPFTTLLGQVSQSFEQGIGQLGQLFPAGAASEISEVRVKPDDMPEMKEQNSAIEMNAMNEMKFKQLLQQAMTDKTQPILWFRNANAPKMNEEQFKKSPEEIILEQKLLAFERQVIKELRLLQEIERQAREMKAASKGMSAKVTKDSGYKMTYPVSQMPVHKITREDVEKALADEYVRKMLQKKANQHENKYMLDSSMPSKRQTAHATNMQTMPFTNEEAVKILAYALRTATGTKDDPQGIKNIAIQLQQQQERQMKQQHLQMQQGPMQQQQRQMQQQLHMEQGPMQQQQRRMEQVPMQQQLLQMEQEPMQQQQRQMQQQLLMEQGPMQQQQRQMQQQLQMEQGPMQQTQLQMEQGPMQQQQRQTSIMREEKSKNEHMTPGNMEFDNAAQMQSIEQLQRNWMQQQHIDEQHQWVADKMNMQQQNIARDAIKPLVENIHENEEDNDKERKIKKLYKGYGKGYGKGINENVYHYHYYLPNRPNSYNAAKPSYNSGSSYGSSYGSTGYTRPSYGYRTAVGSDEIDAMLKNDQAYMRSSYLPTDDSDIVGGILAYTPEVLQPFMGLAAIERPDDPWLIMYSIPLSTVGSYEKYLRNIQPKIKNSQQHQAYI